MAEIKWVTSILLNQKGLFERGFEAVEMVGLEQGDLMSL
jgi:hypothetical protein